MSSNSLKPTYDLDINMAEDPIEAIFNLNNKVRGCSLDLSIHKPRSPSPSPSTISNLSKEEYALHIQRKSDRMVEDEPVKSSNEFSLEYVTQEGQNNQVSKAADFSPNTRMQGAPTADPTLNHPPSENVFNIHLNYDPNQALDPDSWDSNFHAVSLHGSMEHLASDALNIKESLIRMKKYITGKSIEGLKANNIKNLMGMGKALWEFINMVYESQWDALYVDNNTSFRSKVKEKFNPQIKKTLAPGKGKEIIKLTYVLPIPPPIPAKSSKEVKKISKYFKKIENPTSKKSYAQASSNQAPKATTSNVAINTLKIKETFPDLSNKKIDTIQKVINEINNKLKPRINMTTKGPLHKQVIIPMPNKLGKKFTKDSVSQVININCALKNIKSNICADFIISNSKDIIITTNNVASNSNLLEIEKYVKNSLEDNNNTVSSLDFPNQSLTLKLYAFCIMLTILACISPLRISNASSKIITSSMTLSLC